MTTLNNLIINNGVTFTNNISQPAATAAGLYRTIYSGYFADNVDFFATASVTGSGVNTSPISLGTTGDNFSIQWLGYFVPSTTETYTFFTSSDDASYLWIGPMAIIGFTTLNATVNNGGLHGVLEKSGTVNLTQNVWYPIRIQMGESGGAEAMTVNYSTPTITKTTDLTNRIFYNTATNGF